MTAEAISIFPVPEIDSIEADIRERILAVQEKAGFVPNIFLALAARPAEFRAFFDYHDALMEGESALSKGEKEMIVVATSGLNQCLYCVVAHGAIFEPTTSDLLFGCQRVPSMRTITDYISIFLYFT